MPWSCRSPAERAPLLIQSELNSALACGGYQAVIREEFYLAQGTALAETLSQASLGKRIGLKEDSALLGVLAVQLRTEARGPHVLSVGRLPSCLPRPHRHQSHRALATRPQPQGQLGSMRRLIGGRGPGRAQAGGAEWGVAASHLLAPPRDDAAGSPLPEQARRLAVFFSSLIAPLSLPERSGFAAAVRADRQH